MPEAGEKIWFNTKMDEHWHDARFPNRKLFHKGVHAQYEVIEIRRSFRNYDYVLEQEMEGSSDTSGKAVYQFPAQSTVETFEVELKLIKSIGEI